MTKFKTMAEVLIAARETGIIELFWFGVSGTTGFICPEVVEELTTKTKFKFVGCKPSHLTKHHKEAIYAQTIGHHGRYDHDVIYIFFFEEFNGTQYSDIKSLTGWFQRGVEQYVESAEKYESIINQCPEQ